ncbi:hypothetical protein [Nonomuraea sp. GTA35]|uniref:hypothetical protein n=1 Tax=Nonomuraea sp. GTA35 TaxID=1676746 RepID=UPI0035C139D9
MVDFTDTDRNNDATEKFVATLAEADPLLALDTVFSSSNSGTWCSADWWRCDTTSPSTTCSANAW